MEVFKIDEWLTPQKDCKKCKHSVLCGSYICMYYIETGKRRKYQDGKCLSYENRRRRKSSAAFVGLKGGVD